MKIGITKRAVLIERIIQIDIGILAFLLLRSAASYNIIAARQLWEGTGCIGRIASIVLFRRDSVSDPAIRRALFIANTVGNVLITTCDLEPALPGIIAAAQDIDLSVDLLHLCTL